MLWGIVVRRSALFLFAILVLFTACNSEVAADCFYETVADGISYEIAVPSYEIFVPSYEIFVPACEIIDALSDAPYGLCVPGVYEIIDSGDNFRVTRRGEWDLLFEIIDNYGDVIWYWECWGRGWFSFTDSALLRYSAGAGTYAWLAIYFCPRENLLSEMFFNPFFLKDRLVALFDFDENYGRTLVVRDIFDAAVFYFSRPLSDFVADLRPTFSGGITYIGDGEIKISHLYYGDDYQQAVFVVGFAGGI